MKLKVSLMLLFTLLTVKSFGFQGDQDLQYEAKECRVTGVKADLNFTSYRLECAIQKPERFILDNTLFMLPSSKPISDLLLYARTHKILVKVKVSFLDSYRINEVELQ